MEVEADVIMRETRRGRSRAQSTEVRSRASSHNDATSNNVQKPLSQPIPIERDTRQQNGSTRHATDAARSASPLQHRRLLSANLGPGKSTVPNGGKDLQPPVAAVPRSNKDAVATGRVADAPPPVASTAVPNRRLKTPLTTMPGSLFPRSASLAPEPTPGARLSSARSQTRYASAPRSPTLPYRSPVYPSFPLYPSLKGMEDEARHDFTAILQRSPGSSRNPFLVEDQTPATRDVVAYSQDAIRFLSEQHPTPRSSPSPSEPTTPKASTSRYLEPVNFGDDDDRPAKSSWKGKERAHDDDGESMRAETSQEVRIRGTESELKRVREEHRRREEAGEFNANTTAVWEESERDKERIRFLEQEVERLRNQVCFFVPPHGSQSHRRL